jgi:hypothetical protein
MRLFIQIRDGQPFEHPIVESNFVEVFPHIDINNLPPEFANFERVPEPQVLFAEIVDGETYQWFDGIVKNVWAVRQLTDSELTEKKQILFNNIDGRRQSLNVYAQEQIQTAPNETTKQIWEDYVVQLNAWVVTDFDKLDMPHPPRFTANGDLLTVEASGSAPNVVG